MKNFADGILKMTKETEKRRIELKIPLSETVNVLLCFILSQCTLFSSMMPLGFSAYAAFFKSDRWFVYFGAVLLGFIRNAADLKIVAYISAMALSTLFMGFLRLGAKIHHRALCAGISLFCALLCKNILTDFYLYDAFIDFSECVICTLGVYMIDTALPVMLNANDRRYISDVETACVISVFALLIKCFSDFPLLFGLNIAVIAAIALLLIINLEGEIASGAAMGVILGIVSGVGEDSLCAATGAFAFASFCSGLLKRFGKGGVILGFTFANAVMTVFLNGEILPFNIFEVIAASVIFAVVPQKITAYVSSFPAKTVHTSADTTVNHDKLQKVICERLSRLSSSFSSLASSYKNCFENTSMSKQYIIHMLDTASSKICPDCGLKYSCWERGYKASYKAMLDMLEIAENKGKLTIGDIPESFSSKCIKNDAFVNAFNSMFEIYRVEKLWQDRLNESRMLVSGQLKGVAGTINRLCEEFDMCLDVPAEKHLKTALDRENIKADDITFLSGHGSDFSVDITFKNGHCSKKDEQKILDVLNNVTDTKTYLAKSGYYDNSYVITIKPCCAYAISTGSAAIERSGESVSGDSFMICENIYGETVAAISDGMGTGASASKDSSAATELLKNFLSAGIEVDTSLELINSSLLLRSSGENFATMDVCTVNLSDGIVNFSKSGAAPSYIKNEYGISKIESSSLPFGVLNDEEIKTEIFSLENSAVILMVSDGVSDVFGSDEEDGIIKKLESMETVNPQIIASVILNTALELSGGKADDDMTVLAISVWKN